MLAPVADAESVVVPLPQRINGLAPEIEAVPAVGLVMFTWKVWVVVPSLRLAVTFNRPALPVFAVSDTEGEEVEVEPDQPDGYCQV